MTDLLHEKHELFVKLGALFRPLQQLVGYPERYDDQEKEVAIAQYCDEWPQLGKEFEAFCDEQPGRKYAVPYKRFFNALSCVQAKLTAGVPLEDLVPEQKMIAQAAIDSVPLPRTSVILEAGTPFTAYRRLRKLCEIDAAASLVWIDPFLDSSIFHRYVDHVRPDVAVTLVTSRPKASADGRDRTRWDGFWDVSRLYAQERGKELYRLVAQPTLHDRWVMFDGKRIYSLGGSAKDAATRDYFTITQIDASAANLQCIQTQIEKGTELFGPSTPTHQG